MERKRAPSQSRGVPAACPTPAPIPAGLNGVGAWASAGGTDTGGCRCGAGGRKDVSLNGPNAGHTPRTQRRQKNSSSGREGKAARGVGGEEGAHGGEKAKAPKGVAREGSSQGPYSVAPPGTGPGPSTKVLLPRTGSPPLGVRSPAASCPAADMGADTVGGRDWPPFRSFLFYFFLFSKYYYHNEKKKIFKCCS